MGLKLEIPLDKESQNEILFKPAGDIIPKPVMTICLSIGIFFLLFIFAKD
jgi:hypothetical protein